MLNSTGPRMDPWGTPNLTSTSLESVNEIKYLGVHIDYSLSWKDHVKSVTSKMLRGLGMLKQAKYSLPEAFLKTLY